MRFAKNKGYAKTAVTSPVTLKKHKTLMWKGFARFLTCFFAVTGYSIGYSKHHPKSLLNSTRYAPVTAVTAVTALFELTGVWARA